MIPDHPRHTPEQAAILSLLDEVERLSCRIAKLEAAMFRHGRRCDAYCVALADRAKGKGRSRATDSSPKSTRSQGDQA